MTWLRSKKVFWISAVAFCLSQTTIVTILAGVAPLFEIIQQQITFSPKEFVAYLSKWGPDKTRLFLIHYYFDFLHPFIYAVFFSSLLARLNSPKKFHWMLFLLISTSIFDSLENLIQLPINAGWLSPSSWLFFVGVLSSNLKWICAIATFLSILHYSIMRRTAFDN